MKLVKNRFVLFVVLAAALFWGCEKPKEKGILTKEQMINVLCKIYVAEDKAGRVSAERDSSQYAFDYFMKNINEETGLSDSVIKRSLKYYNAHPAELEQIYTAVVDSLNLKEQRTSEEPAK